jgi:OmpA-OmpF porin, OOP family
MPASLLDGLTGLITPDVVSKAASALGESEAAIRKGVAGAFPALLSGIASRADDSSFASSLFDLVQSPANDASIINDVGSLVSANSSSPITDLGTRLMGLLFGGRASAFTNTLAGYAGIRRSTASTLMNVAAPLVLAYIGRRARNDGLNATSLATLLRNQKHSYAAAVPGQLANAGRYPEMPVKDRKASAAPAIDPRATTWRWLLPALAAIVGLALLIPLFGRKEQVEVRDSTMAAVGSVRVPEHQSVAPTAATPSGTVYFAINQAALPANAVQSLSSVIKYLQANPGATAVVSGYHDATGDQAANEELAKNRADAVRSSLVAAGIEASRIEMQKPVVTEGEGPPERAHRVEVTAS